MLSGTESGIQEFSLKACVMHVYWTVSKTELLDLAHCVYTKLEIKQSEL